jgi:uncharacterized membrane protein
VGTLITLGISVFVAVKIVSWTHLFGTGSEDALLLQSLSGNVNLRGLLLGGMILGLLGVLDDVTTGQAAIVEELRDANPALSVKELYRRGLSVGREHITSLINTLFLAYTGATLPLFLLFTLNQGQPFWMIVNSEQISDEIVRTVVGSSCLILAVPITTLLAAYFFGKMKWGKHSGRHHPHLHIH